MEAVFRARPERPRWPRRITGDQQRSAPDTLIRRPRAVTGGSRRAPWRWAIEIRTHDAHAEALWQLHAHRARHTTSIDGAGHDRTRRKRATLSGWPSRRAASSRMRNGFQPNPSSRSAITTPAVSAAALTPCPCRWNVVLDFNRSAHDRRRRSATDTAVCQMRLSLRWEWKRHPGLRREWQRALGRSTCQINAQGHPQGIEARSQIGAGGRHANRNQVIGSVIMRMVAPAPGGDAGPRCAQAPACETVSAGRESGLAGCEPPLQVGDSRGPAPLFGFALRATASIALHFAGSPR